MIVSLPPRDPDLRRALSLRLKFQKLQFVKTSSQTAGKIPSGGPGGTGGGSVNGSGTDNHIARWDGTGNIQDSGWVIADTTNKMSLSQASAGVAQIAASNSSTTDASTGVAGTAGGATGAVIGILGITGSSNSAAYGGSFTAGNTAAGGNAAIRSNGALDIVEYDVPADPDTGIGRLYAYTDGTLHYINDASVDTDLCAAGGSGYAEVQEEGAAVTARTKINFIGPRVTAADDAGNSRTNVTISAAALGANSDITSASGLTGAISKPTQVLMANAGVIDTDTGAANTLAIEGYATGSAIRIPVLTVTNAALTAALDFPIGATWNGNEIYRATGTDVPLTDGGTGASTAAGALLNITGWVNSAVSGSNFTTTSTSLVNITGLSFACAANTLYEFQGWLVVGTSAVTTGTKYGVQYSAAGATVGCELHGTVTNTTGAVTSLQALNSGSATTFLTTSGVKGFVHVNGWLQTGANAGDLTLQTLKVTSGTSTVFIGSSLKVRVAGV